MARRILEYFDRIDQSAGKASRMDLLRIAGNEAEGEDAQEYVDQVQAASDSG